MKRRHSLSGKLMLLFIVTAVIIALTERGAFRFGIQDELRSLAEPHLLEYIEHLRDEIGNPPDYASAKALAERLALEIHARGPGGTWSINGVISDLSRLDFHRHRINGRSIEVSRSDHRFVVRLMQGENRILLIPKRLEHSRQVPLAVLLTIFLVLAIIALAYHLVRRLFQPIDSLRQGVSRFGAGDLDHRIRVDRRDELGELAQSINTMAGDIQQMLEAKRQLLLAISHELRSPLTRARVNAELLEPGDLQQRLIHDLQEMESQLTELLETERLDSRHAKLDLAAVSPSALIKEVIEQHFGADQFSLQQSADETYVTLDGMRIRLLLKNLLDNALRHTLINAPRPEIHSRLEADRWLLSVVDHGEGIPPEHLPHLTEPFYRVDKARQRDTGGYGLGLYLCRVIAEAHAGNLQINSTRGSGTRVTVTLPLRVQQPPEDKTTGSA